MDRPATRPIVFITDMGMFRPTLVAINSILRRLSIPVKIIFMGIEIPDDARDYIGQLISTHPSAELYFIDFDRPLPSNAGNHAAYISPATMARMFLPEMLDEQVLYLDGDIIARTDLAPLLSTPMTHPLAGVRDFVVLRHIARGRPEKLIPFCAAVKADAVSGYINAGVLLMDCPTMANDNTALQDMVAMTSLSMRDQDRLNGLYQDRIQYLGPEWNSNWGQLSKHCGYAIKAGLADEIGPNTSMPAIVHYNSRVKPWHPLRQTLMRRPPWALLEWRLEYREMQRRLTR